MRNDRQEIDPETGIKEWFIDTPDGFQIAYEQDCEAILESNKEKQSYGAEYFKSKGAEGEYWKVASIPIVIQYKWMIEDGIDIMNRDHMPKVIQKLNDPDWRYLKTAEVII